MRANFRITFPLLGVREVWRSPRRRGARILKIDFAHLKPKLKALSFRNLSEVSSGDLKNSPYARGRTVPVSSSVILPFCTSGEETGILLTRRSKHLKSHPGQMSFPGGVQEEGEYLLETCLREWEEEMGVSSDHLTVIGKFHGLVTITGYHITPFVAYYEKDLDFHLSDEVEEAFIVDVSSFWEIDYYCIDFQRSGRNRVYYFSIPGRGLLWGATCEIWVRFLEEFLDFDRIPQSVEPNLPNPPFFQVLDQ